MRQIFKSYIGIIFILYIMVLFTGCDDETKVPTEARLRDQAYLDEFLLTNSDYSLFYNALEQADLLSILSGEADYTIFAPNNQAFGDFLVANGYDGIDEIPADELSAILNYHIIEGINLETGLTSREVTSEGNALNIFTVGDVTWLNGKGSIEDSDIILENGIVHGINTVLIPPSGDIMEVLSEQNDEAGDEFTLFQMALERTGLDATLSGNSFYTVLAPTDAAFEAAGIDAALVNSISVDVLLGILNFHIIEGLVFSQEFTDGRIYTLLGEEGEAQGLEVDAGASITINGSAVTDANILATNGVIHVIEDVLFEDYTLLEALDPDNELTGVDGVLFFHEYYEAIIRLGYEENLISLEESFTIYTSRGFDQSAIVDDAALLSYLESRIFEGNVNYLSVPSGTKITSIGGDEYFVTKNSVSTTINGSASNAFTTPATYTVYNGLIVPMGFGVMTPLPEETIVEQLSSDPDYDLVGAALAKSGLIEEDVNYTFLAVDDAGFLAEFPDLVDVATVEGLDPDDEDDAELIEELATYFGDHLIEQVYFNVDLVNDLPDVEAVSGKTISFVDAGTDLGIVDDPKFPTDYMTVSGNLFRANNGVIHGLDRSLVLE